MASLRMRQPAAAEYCGVSQSFLAKGRCHGYGPKFLKLGKAVVYDLRDLDAWLEQSRRTSTSDTNTLGLRARQLRGV